MKVTIQKLSLLLEIQATIPNNSQQPQISGFTVEEAPGDGRGIILVGANNKTMFVMHDPLGTLNIPFELRPVIKLPKQMLDAIKKHDGLHTNLVIENRDGTSIATLYDGQMPIMAVWNVIQDAEYPDWKRMIPLVDMEQPIAAGRFNSHLLSTFHKLGPAKGGSGLSFFSNHEKGAFIVKVVGRTDMFGVISPLAGEPDDAANLPWWYVGADNPNPEEIPEDAPDVTAEDFEIADEEENPDPDAENETVAA